MTDPAGIEHLFASSTRFAGIPPTGVRALGPDGITFGGGYPDPVRYPVDALAELFAAVVHEDASPGLDYGGPMGVLRLRELIAARMAERDGIALDADGVIVTTGAAGAFAPMVTAFLEPGDVVVVEDLTYPGVLTAFRMAGASVVAAPLDDDGVDIVALEQLLDRLHDEGRRVKLLYLIATCQNPTGSVLPVERRETVAALARRHDFVIVQDNTYGDLQYRAGFPPSLLAAAPERTLHLGSFSKTVAPGLRLGWVVAAALVIVAMLGGIRTDLGTSPVLQRVVARFLAGGTFDPHLAASNEHYREKRDVLVQALDAHCGAYCTWRVPEGGFSIWLDLRAGTTETLSGLAAQEGVSFIPGSYFSAAGPRPTSLRVVFGRLGPDDLEEGARRLGRAMARLEESR